jgi:hypothetical protein
MIANPKTIPENWRATKSLARSPDGQWFLEVAEFARIQVVSSGPNSGEFGYGVDGPHCRTLLSRAALVFK